MIRGRSRWRPRDTCPCLDADAIAAVKQRLSVSGQSTREKLLQPGYVLRNRKLSHVDQRSNKSVLGTMSHRLTFLLFAHLELLSQTCDLEKAVYSEWGHACLKSMP